MDIKSIKFLKILTRQDWQLGMHCSRHMGKFNPVCPCQKSVVSYPKAEIFFKR